jgi:hypothetical protein
VKEIDPGRREKLKKRKRKKEGTGLAETGLEPTTSRRRGSYTLWNPSMCVQMFGKQSVRHL